jgi:hypothetical protein
MEIRRGGRRQYLRQLIAEYGQVLTGYSSSTGTADDDDDDDRFYDALAISPTAGHLADVTPAAAPIVAAGRGYHIV